MKTGSVVGLVGLPMMVMTLALLAAMFNAVLESRSRGAGLALSMPLRESARLLGQQRRTIAGADSLLWRIGGAGLVVAAFLQVIVVPVGEFVAADLSVGVVWFNAVDVALWALWWLLGWGANSLHSLVGGYRILAQVLAYELPLMFALTAPVVAASSLRVGDVVAAQNSTWFVVWMPVATVVYLLSVAAFSSWGPFATGFGADAATGVVAELSGVDRLVVLAGRYALLVSGAAFAVPMFFGGGSGPLLPEWSWVIVKTLVLTAGLVWLRRGLPILRPQRLAEVGWVVLIPLTLVQVLMVALIAASGGV